MLVVQVQPAWAAQRQLPLLPAPATPVTGASAVLPAISLPGGFTNLPLADNHDGKPPSVHLEVSGPNDQNPQNPVPPASSAADQSADSAHHPVDPPFYGRQKPPTEKPRTRKYIPNEQDSARAQGEFLRIAAVGQELFNAPTWFEKGHHPSLKKSIFNIAFLDEALTDIANGQSADVPNDLTDEQVVEQVIARRAQAYQGYLDARREILTQTATQAAKRARIAIERWHREGAAPNFDASATFAAADHYKRMQEIAEGKSQATPQEVALLAQAYDRSIRLIGPVRRARVVDEKLAMLRVGPFHPEHAKKIYDKSISAAKVGSEENAIHASERLAAAKAGTVYPAPNLGKQIRPTCTMHMLQSLLSALGIKRRLPDLVAEARAILNDPYVGMTTAFNLEQQLKLFRHYGTVATVKNNVFETLVAHGRNLKISIEIGDPIYKHSLLLEGFYEVDGVTYVALRDSTSYFPTRMTLEDFAAVLTDDAAVLFLEAQHHPKP